MPALPPFVSQKTFIRGICELQSKLELENQLIGWIEFNGVKSAAGCSGDGGGFAIPDKCGNMYEVYIDSGPSRWHVGSGLSMFNQSANRWFCSANHGNKPQKFDMSQDGHKRMKKLTGRPN
uniref:Uncharacterized protein n=1 Tax=Marseillevirus LCMAC102 TaxID=2506603 RepID=A0A481YU08_9VIRU|nr:MAG: hypothetical protein LCMAC102_03740 [Marseillevirus LCMAC102]